ncbi:MAG: hypothetical protein H6621_09975 [Halobacteriovoraceae bacterium]|nr:hypothetical protein [Halobacteriovoraceae bacterium]MCB9095384.1 hypothetical protein [Halobacteriovoraceae bacterium]
MKFITTFFIIVFVSSFSYRAEASFCDKLFALKNYLLAKNYPTSREYQQAYNALLKDTTKLSKGHKAEEHAIHSLNFIRAFRKESLNASRKSNDSIVFIGLQAFDLSIHPSFHNEFYVIFGEILESKGYYQSAMVYFDIAGESKRALGLKIQVANYLYENNVTIVKEIAKESATPTYLAHTDNGTMVLVKPNQEIHLYSPWRAEGEKKIVHHTSLNEAGAYIYGMLLKNYTPLLVRRKALRSEYKIVKGEDITIQLMIPRILQVDYVIPPKNQFQMFDYIIGNVDRYRGNYARYTTGAGDLRNFIVLRKLDHQYVYIPIDGGAAFAPDEMLIYSKRFTTLSKFEFPINREQYMRVKGLNDELLKELLQDVLPEELIADSLKRKSALVRFIEAKIKNKGESYVFSD